MSTPEETSKDADLLYSEAKSKLTHVNASGEARMVDVGDKGDTRRTAVACSRISMSLAAASAIRTNSTSKGDC